ncbi:MAG: Na/Pi symporter [Alcaligenaceae bacterium]|nr:Na/Pi symporter [Alcaligenaceae bacterium]
MTKRFIKPLLTVSLLAAIGYTFSQSNAWLVLCYGLALFLFGLQCIKEGLQNSVGGAFEKLLTHSTSTKLKGFGFGVLATFFLQSSTLVSLLTMAFLSTGMINLVSGIAINLGTNIGATSGLWLLALIGHNVSLSAVAMPMLVFGIIFSYLEEKYKFFGRVLIGIALIFIGIDAIKMSFDSVDNLAILQSITVTGVGEIILFSGVGLLVTMALQSSHATLILTLALLGSGQIELVQAFAIALGSNLGSSASTSFVGILGNDRKGQRLAIAHLIFNISSVFLGLIFWVPLTAIVAYVARKTGMNELLQLAFFHTLINFVGIVAFWPWPNHFARFLYRLLPDKKESTLFVDQDKTAAAIYLQSNMLRSGDTAYRAVFQELQHFAELCLEVICHVLFIDPKDLRQSDENGVYCLLEASPAVPPLELNAQELYEAQIKPIYSELLDFVSKMDISSELHKERLKEANIVMLRMVDIIKDAKHLQKNMQIYLQRADSAPHQEYVRLRQYLFKTLCLAQYVLNSRNDSFEWQETMVELGHQTDKLDEFRNRAMRKLRKNKLDGWQTSSLMNDSRYARDIAYGLMEILQMPLIVDSPLNQEEIPLDDIKIETTSNVITRAEDIVLPEPQLAPKKTEISTEHLDQEKAD